MSDSGKHRRALWIILLTVFLDLLGFGMVIPILPLYASEMHASVPQIGWLLSIYSIMQLIFAPLWGRLSDRVGRRPVLLVSVFGSCVSQLGYALSPSFPYLVLSRAVAGMCGANISAAQAYIADVTDERSRAGAMGLIGAALGLGFVFGPFVGGELGKIDARLPFAVASALAAVNFVGGYFLLEETHGARRRTAVLTWEGLLGVLSAPRLLGLLVLFLVVTFGFANMEGVFALFCKERFGYDEAHVGRLFALVGVVMVVVQGLLVRRLAPWLGERRLLMLGIALMGAGLLMMALAHGVLLLVLSVTTLAAGSGLNTPSMSALITRLAGEQKGAVLGVSQSLGALGRILGPIIGTRLFASVGVPVPLLVASGCMAAGLVLALTVVRRAT